MAANKIHTVVSRALLLAVYAVFFTVQLTAYFDHKTGHIYRLGTEVFHSSTTVKDIQVGLSNGHSSAKKVAIRLNKKFHAQSVILYAIFVSKAPVADFIKQPFTFYFNAPDADALLTEHSLRGPPAVA